MLSTNLKAGFCDRALLLGVACILFPCAPNKVCQGRAGSDDSDRPELVKGCCDSDLPSGHDHVAGNGDRLARAAANSPTGPAQAVLRRARDAGAGRE
jgi:hypothetical protein